VGPAGWVRVAVAGGRGVAAVLLAVSIVRCPVIATIAAVDAIVVRVAAIRRTVEVAVADPLLIRLADPA